MTYHYLTVEDEGALAIVTLNRPEKRNALSKELRVELREVAEELDGRDDLACVLVTGAGAAFCGGADVGQADSFGDGVPLAQARRIVRQGADMCAAWERLRCLTIAVVNGAVHVAENSRHRIVRYDRDGKVLAQWGKRSRQDVKGFGACCNPMNLE